MRDIHEKKEIYADFSVSFTSSNKFTIFSERKTSDRIRLEFFDFTLDFLFIRVVYLDLEEVEKGIEKSRYTIAPEA